MRLSRQDFTLAIRTFARAPGFTITAVLSLGLAIALNTTMYSVLDALVNPEIDARAPSRLYRIQIWGDFKHKVDDQTRAAMLRDLSGVVETMTYTASDRTGLGIEYGNRYTQLSAMRITPSYFDVLRIGPYRGRAFTSADLSADMPPVIINARLAGTLSPDRDFPIGDRITIDGVAHPVIGIVRQGPSLFLLPPPWQSLASLPPNLVRLRDGITPQDAERQLEFISRRFADAAGEDRKVTGFLLKRADAGQFHFANFHFALIAAVIAVLVIACANLANLQLARGIARSREFAMRVALGAARRDIIAQLLVESGTLAVIGLVAGLVATMWAMHLIAARIPPTVAEYVVAPRVSWRLVLFAISACLFSTMIIGLYPAIKVSRVDPNELLKAGAGTGANRKHRQQYGVMVAVEIGLALAVLSGAAVVVRTALAVREIRTGFDPKPLSLARVYLRAPADTVIARRAYANDLLAAVKSIPDAASAALFEYSAVGHQSVTIEQHDGPPLERLYPGGGYRTVSPSYLRTLQLPIIKGRDFLDGAVSEPEVIVDRRFAGRYWPGVDPIGLRIKFDDSRSNAPWGRVVGVSAERGDENMPARARNAGQMSAGEVFVVAPFADSVRMRKGRVTAVSVVVRAKTDFARMPVTLRRHVPKSDLIAYTETSSMEESMSLVQLRQEHDFVASLFTLFAGLAVALAAIGVYGIVNHSVNERRRELGVRLALGASARDVVRAVVRDGNPMVLAGVAIGLYLIKRTVLWLQGYAFEGDEYDALLFASMGACLFIVALGSALIPAWRATRIDPVESLRSE